MSTITYRCDTCKREIEVLENTTGLTVFSKCIITDGCRGTLQRISRNQSSVRETFPSPESGLTDYFPRRAFYEHQQPIPAAIWNVFHGLSVSPEVTVWEDNNGTYVELDQDEYTVDNTSIDQLSITFPSARSGIAHCLAKTSVPINPKVLIPEIEPELVTEAGSIVFAVPEIITDTENPDFTAPFYTRDYQLRVEVQVIKPNEEPVTCPEEIDGDLIQTSWSGWDRSLVRNRRHYTLRTKELINFRAFSDIRTANEDIPEGTVIRFLRVDYGDGVFREIESRGLFVFLSKEPFQSIDKVRDRLVDSGEMLGTDLDFFIYSEGDLYTNVENIENTYPDIKQALIPPVPTPTPTPTPSGIPCPLLPITTIDSFATDEGKIWEYVYAQFNPNGTYTFMQEAAGTGFDEITEDWATDAPLTNGSDYEIKWEFVNSIDEELEGDENFFASIPSDQFVTFENILEFRLSDSGSSPLPLRITIRSTNVANCEITPVLELEWVSGYYYGGT